jgi:hypothetical protein
VTGGIFQTANLINDGVIDSSNAPGGKVTFRETDIIKGNGTYRGHFEGGIWSPGQSPGILSVDGVLDMTPDATLEIELAGPATGAAGTDFDQLYVVAGSGNQFKPGGTLKIVPLSGAQVGGTYRIVRTGGGGAAIDTSRYFANLASSGTIYNDGSLKYEVNYDSQFIDVHLTAVPEPTGAAILLLSSGMLFRRRRSV